MTDAPNLRRLIKNEAIFRDYNENIQQGLVELKRMAKETGQEDYLPDEDPPLHFYCECSNIRCRRRIVLKPKTYDMIHKNRKRFIVVRGHEVGEIEKSVTEKDNYSVVEKFRSATA